MGTQAAGKRSEGFTLIELLIVIAIIAVLAAMLLPAVQSARAHVQRQLTRTEIGNLALAMELYYIDWDAYPPDSATLGADSLNSGECLVFYLANTFRVNPVLAAGDIAASRNGGPYYEFPPNRLSDSDFDDYDQFVDRFGLRAGVDVDYYQFDNNLAEDGSEDWGLDNNFSNVHPRRVDIWSAGPDGTDEVSDDHPTRDNVTTIDLGDDIGNW